MERLGALSWVQDLLEDPSIRDVCLNGPGRAFVDRGEGLRPGASPEGTGAPESYFAWVIDLLGACGRSWDARAPYVDASVAPSLATPGPAARLHVLFPPVSGAVPLVSIRRLSSVAALNPWLGTPGWGPLAEIIRARENLLICGATGSGKTTLLSALLRECAPEERIVALEDTPELAPGLPHFLGLCSRAPNADGHGEVTLRTLLRQTLRMRPDRLVIGECRGAEVLDLLMALNTGHRGACGTLHANSARDGLRRIELLAQVASPHPLPLGFIRELIAGTVHWIAHVERVGNAHRIAELSQVAGREGDTILLRPMISWGR